VFFVKKTKIFPHQWYSWWHCFDKEPLQIWPHTIFLPFLHWEFIIICDQIFENGFKSHIHIWLYFILLHEQYRTFQDMNFRTEILKKYSGNTTALYKIPVNTQRNTLNYMCDLEPLSKIWSHLSLYNSMRHYFHSCIIIANWRCWSRTKINLIPSQNYGIF